jgi:hypothetical protein
VELGKGGRSWGWYTVYAPDWIGRVGPCPQHMWLCAAILGASQTVRLRRRLLCGPSVRRTGLARPGGQRQSGESAGVAGGEESRERPGHSRYDEDRPHFQEHIDDAAPCRQRGLELRRDREELNGREEDGITEAVNIPTFDDLLEHVRQDRPDYADQKGQAEHDRESRQETAMAILPAR